MRMYAQGLRSGALYWTLRSVCSALLTAVVLCLSVTESATAATVQGGVNHTNAAPSPELSFSATPTNAELLRAGLFTEPLAPVAETTAQENHDLAQALLAYRDAIQRTGANDAVEPFLVFLKAHPNTPWKPALQLDLGIVYRQTGHFSKALEIWQTGWRETQSLTDPQGLALANAMVARLSQLEAYLGRKELLQPLLDAIHSRPVGGTAAQLITDSHTGLYEMLHQPESSFRCGPLALTRILKYSNNEPSPASLKVLDEARSTPNGLSLTAVQEISDQAGMHYQMAFRSPGAAVVMPAVAHWKVGHYAAIVDRENGRYLVQDTTFGEDIRVGQSTLDEEASGYFLVPRGKLPEGWRKVSAEEGAQVWGRGNTGSNHDSGDTGCECGNTGVTVSTVEPQVVGLQLNDSPLGYDPPVGPPVRFNLIYSHRDTQQPTTFSYTNFGRKWTFNWLSYITDTVKSSASAVLYRRGGGSEPYTFSSTSATTAYAGPYSHSVLTRTVNSSNTSTGFTLTFPNGSYQEFNQVSGTRFFLTAVADQAGNKVTLTYDSQMRIVAITDAIGQVSTLTYGLSASPLVVTQITDPFGRSASFTYNASGQLQSITDVLGIASSYAYGQGTDPDFINTLSTPYGLTTFTYGDSSTNSALGTTRFLKTTDPLNRTSYVEYAQNVDAADSSGGVMKNSSLIPTGLTTCNAYLHYRNTFIFDANQYALATQGSSLNYGLAKVMHWLHSSDGSSASRFKESEKEPLENREWYNYPGQPTSSCGSIYATVSSGGAFANGATNKPSVIARVLDSGTTQIQKFTYNSYGNVTQVTDAVGRQTTFTYAANGIDLLSVANTTNGTQLLETRTYNSQHLPLTVTGENGIVARSQYNTAGQLTRYTDQQGHATALTYDANGYLKTYQRAIAGAQYSFAYDASGRVAAITDPAGSTVRYTYDAADRLIGATYPDSTSTHFTYELLDIASATDRLGHTTQYEHNAARELVQITDPLGHTVQQGYNLAGELNSITDSNGHTTTVLLDAQGRLIGKQLADGSSLSVVYQNALSLKATVTDARNQTTTYSYNPDNSIAAINYDALLPTASVSFTYDPLYPRVINMVDGTGVTTYSYYPISSAPALGANELKSVTSPIAGAAGYDTVTYSYDALNRVVGYNVNGVTESVSFDALGRINSVSNSLDAFTYSYADATERITGMISPHGPVFSMSYFGPQGNELLKQLNAATQSGVALAQFEYAHNANGDVTSVVESVSGSRTTTYAYDAANRLLSALVGADQTTQQYAYEYDPASNLTSITANGSQQSLAYTSTNALASGTYDANGNLTALGDKAYAWDGADRIVSFTDSLDNSSSFTYDGLGRLVRVVDFNAGSVIADHSYFWCGWVRCLAHDNTQNSSPVSARYFDQGVLANGTAYYYVQDQLGSVRQLVTTTGSVAAQYDYDAYGNSTLVSGTDLSDIGYAGYFYHLASGLNFTLYRAYDPSHGRWLNRDPIGEAGGINLYAYVDGNPLNYIDPEGLSGNRGERGRTRSPSGTPNPYKHYRQDPNNPNKVIYRDPQTGQKISKPKPPDFPSKPPSNNQTPPQKPPGEPKPPSNPEPPAASKPPPGTPEPPGAPKPPGGGRGGPRGGGGRGGSWLLPGFCPLCPYADYIFPDPNHPHLSCPPEA